MSVFETDETPRAAAPPATRADEDAAFFRYDFSNFYHGAGSDPVDLLGPFKAWYDEALDNGYYLYSEPLETAPSTRVRVRNRKTGQTQELLNLASYNYLGISYRDEVKAAAVEAIRRYGLGASGSPILSGTFDVHGELARRLASFKKKEAAILFPTGYGANVGCIAGLMRSGDSILMDQYAHASIVDGAVLAKSRVHYFRHNDARDLDRKLSRCTGKRLVVVEGVYSMDGDLCDLPAIVAVAKKHGARILVDEAHSTFLFGESGRGVAEHFGLEDEIDFHLGTFSKSLGGQGGFVCGSRALVDYLNAFGRSRFFSCNLAPAIAAGLLAGLTIVETEPALRRRLWRNVALLRELLVSAGVDVGKTSSQIIPVLVKNDAKVFAVAERIQEAGLYLQPVTYPAVPKHQSRMRISVSAAHTEADLELAARVIRSALEQEGLI
jgi:glycine C-acetyltransferase